MNVVESCMKLVALSATQVRQWMKNGSVRQNMEAGARIHVSKGMDRDVTVRKYKENG